MSIPQEINIHITEQTFTPITTAPTVDNLTAVGVTRGVRFTWDAVDLYPYYWEYKLKVGALGWSAWVRTNGSTVLRQLNDAELASQLFDATISIEVRNSDASDSDTASDDCLGLTVNTGEVGTFNFTDLIGTIAIGQVPDATLTATKFSGGIGGSLLTDDYLEQGSVDDSTISFTGGALLVRGLGITATQLATDAVESAKIKANAVTNAKITNATIEVAKLATSATDQMFRSGDRTKLEGALGVDMDDIDASDVILIAVGADKNLVANKVSIKTDVGLNLVENYTAVNQVTNGLSNAVLVAKTTAVISGNATANQMVIAAINASTEGVTINNNRITELSCLKVKDSGLGGAVFDGTGYGLIGIKYSTTARTSLNIVTAIDGSGQATNLDLTNIGSGDLDDISDGTNYGKVALASVLGADYAITGLHTDGSQKVGVYDGTTVASAADIVARVDEPNVKFFTSKESTGVTDLDVLTYAGAGYSPEKIWTCVYNTGEDTFNMKIWAANTNGDATARLKIYSVGTMTLLATGTAVTLATIPVGLGNYHEYTLSVTLPAVLVAADLYRVGIELAGVTSTVNLKDYVGYTLT